MQMSAVQQVLQLAMYLPHQLLYGPRWCNSYKLNVFQDGKIEIHGPHQVAMRPLVVLPVLASSMPGALIEGPNIPSWGPGTPDSTLHGHFAMPHDVGVSDFKVLFMVA